MLLSQARTIAEDVVEKLRPHCERIEIAGSIRRQKPEVGDIEIVCIPKPYENVGLFETGIATVINKWQKLKGELPCKYTARRLPDGIDVDIFMVGEDNWGWQLAIRTGSAEFSHRVLAVGLNKRGLTSKEGIVQDCEGNKIKVVDEESLFRLIGVAYIEPQNREFGINATGEELRDRGIKESEEHANEAYNDWSEKAYNFLIDYMRDASANEFMAEDVRDASKNIVPEPPNLRAWGSVIVRAIKSGLIERAGYREVSNAKAHRTPATVWRIL